jgi:beta-galactosidase
MLVNGIPTKLKGVCLHQDVAAVGNAVTKSLLRQKLSLFKSFGCNAIRTSHNIPSLDLLDLCDEMGFYVLEEWVDKWTTGSYGRYFASEWEHDLTYMVKRDRNRACVIMWSVGNEVYAQGSDSMLTILDSLIANVKRYDGRPVTVACSPHYAQPDEVETKAIDEVLSIIDKIADRVDVIGLNYQEQWYSEIRAKHPDKLIVGTETYLFFRGSRERYFNYNTQNPWLDVVNNDYAIGGFVWAGMDYLGESMGWPSKGWCGAMTRSNFERKPISWLFESYWSSKPVVHITVLDYTLRDEMVREPWSFPPMIDTWHFPQYRYMPMQYMIFTNCEKVHLSLKNRDFDILNRSDFANGIITGYLPLEPGPVTAEGIIDGKIVCTHSLNNAHVASRLVFDDKTPVPLLTVRVVDAEGNQCMRESSLVRFTVEGDCTIEGVDNGDMMRLSPYNTDSVHLFHGCASVVLRITGNSNVKVTAYADGIEEATFRL